MGDLTLSSTVEETEETPVQVHGIPCITRQPHSVDEEKERIPKLIDDVRPRHRLPHGQ